MIPRGVGGGIPPGIFIGFFLVVFLSVVVHAGSIDRFKNPIFAFSKGVRKLTNEPTIVTLIRLDVYEPKQANFDDSMQEIAKKFHADHEFHLGYLLPYQNQVVPHAQHLLPKYPGFGLNALKALNLYTKQTPNFYGAISNLMYLFGDSKSDNDIEPFGDFLFHFDKGIKQLASSPHPGAPFPDSVVAA